ncbi:MAG: hypothetical protein AAGI46_00830 [Planctomycetota bacterium]
MTQNMPRTTIVAGVLLILLGLLGFVFGGGFGDVQEGLDHGQSFTKALADSPTRSALIPLVPGVAIGVCGVIALLGPKPRMIAMHLAVLLGLLGALATMPPIFARVLPGKASALAIVSVVGMLVLCGGYVIIAVQSFIAARKARKEAEGFEVVR